MTLQQCDVLIVGGGIVGLSVLRAATLQGYSCILIEKEPDLLHWASGSNSGIACTGVDASPGSLERALIRDSISQFRYFCRDMNIPTKPCGSLVCQWSWDDAQSDNNKSRLEHVLAESHDAGDTHATLLSSPERVIELEPNINRDCIVGAVHIPGEVVVDPWLYSIAFAVHARENGARIYTNFGFDPNLANFDGKMWTVQRPETSVDDATDDTYVSTIRARVIVSATGLWSDTVQESIHGSSKWAARPRRGQYLVFDSTKRTEIVHPIQPVPTQFTKGVFVFSTLYNQIVVGPTALDQTSKTDRTADTDVSDLLAQHVKKIIPNINVQESLIGNYVGIRPGTDKRDYQIHVTYSKKWIAAAGIRSTGLTASLGIGRHVTSLIQGVLNDIHPTPLQDIKTTPLPDVQDLATQYRDSSDGSVDIGGYRYRVTHPLTIFGWRNNAKMC